MDSNFQDAGPVSGSRPTWAEINLDRLSRNYRLVKTHVGPKVQVMAMVKADAYGHGAVGCALHLEKTADPDWFGVATVEEAVQLRTAGVRSPILCLGGFWRDQHQALFRHGLTPTVFRLDMVETLDEAARSAGIRMNVHVKVDTGMGRLGFRPEQLDSVVETLKRCPSVRLEGVLTHFASADDLDQEAFTQRQIAVFRDSVEKFRRAGFEVPLLHLANSAGTNGFPEAHAGLVRIGGLLYGTIRDIVSTRREPLPVRPVMSLHSRIVLLKTVEPGDSLGYGRAFIAAERSRIATLPIGYADGVSRAHTNRGEVLVRERRAPIVGRISMDLTLIDVTRIPDAEVGDTATFFGRQGEAEITTEEYAAQGGTIGLEATTTVSDRVARIHRGAE